MKLFISSISGKVEIRTETLDGREYLVAPVIPIKEGVMNGELSPKDEISKYVDAWNGIPVTINHNYDENGKPISANKIDFLESNGVGRLFNCSFDEDDNKLLAELWIDTEKVEDLGGDALTALERLRNHEPLEVSTGFFRDTEKKTGVFNGRRYSLIQHNMRPDHLALLPNDTGACSWEDGCGAPRVNCEDCEQGECFVAKKTEETEGVENSVTENVKKLVGKLAQAIGFKVNEEGLGDAERRKLLEGALKEQLGEDEWAWIEDVYSDEADSYMIYDSGGDYYKQSYEIDDDLNTTLTGDPVEVALVKQWKVKGEGENGEPVDNKNTGEGEQLNDKKKLNKEELVSALVANKCAELTEDELKGMDEGVLQKMHVALADCQKNDDPGNGEEEKPAANKNDDPGKKGEGSETGEQGDDMNEIKQFMSAVKKLGGIDTIKELADNAKSEKERLEAEKEKLVTELAANEKCAFEEDDLKTMTVNQLTKLKRSLSPGNYAGVGGPSIYRVGEEDAIPEPPRILTAKKKKEEEKEEKVG